MPHIFISYAKKDTRELAIALSDALNALPNVTAWVDRSLKAGKSWELQIQTEIDKCDYFVVLYSPDINRHKQGEEESYVLTEIAYAKHTLKKPIIPVMAQKTTAPISLTTLHYIDYTLPGLKLYDLLEAICTEAGIIVGTQSIGSVNPLPLPAVVRKTKDLLPAPFDWCPIPSGKVTLKEGGYIPQGGKTFDVPAFYMAKYPVTNAQYRLFVEAGGYQNKQWWADAGWQAKEAEAWTEPCFWADAEYKTFAEVDKPVVGLSWYEAIAFCNWLSELTSEKISLPTEQQWQRAAQGDTRLDYPWGGNFERTKANTGEEGYGKTTAVTAYPNGASPYGVFDMSGNVWEWCLTDIETGSNYTSRANARVLRGGSFIDGAYIARTTYRNYSNPIRWNIYFGFRLCAASIKP